MPHELVICTSEILRNKVVKQAGAAADAVGVGGGVGGGEEGGGWEGDADLRNLGCVVSDEIHYINDVDRGSVWEETLMHLPSSVQMVALSATLRAPEAFLGWIGCVPRPPG